MFTGKGGVGKTTCAAATALHCASSGKQTLTISTDATPSLAHIFEISGQRKPARVRESLYLSELGETEVKEMWDGKFGKEVYEVFSFLVDIGYEEFVEFMTSILPGLSDEFMVDYIRELSRKGQYEAIIWDTAPLGQTLALLETPALLEKQAILKKLNMVVGAFFSEVGHHLLGRLLPYFDNREAKCAHLKIIEVPMFPYELKGLDRLEEVAGRLFQ